MDIEFENMGTVNKNRVDIGNLTLWFSYKTCVAVRDETGLYCIENLWGPTTGKLLNQICPDKSQRLSHDEFKTKLNEIVARINVGVQVITI